MDEFQRILLQNDFNVHNFEVRPDNAIIEIREWAEVRTVVDEI